MSDIICTANLGDKYSAASDFLFTTSGTKAAVTKHLGNDEFVRPCKAIGLKIIKNKKSTV